jgi:hypothetical protein
MLQSAVGFNLKRKCIEIRQMEKNVSTFKKRQG